MSEVLSRWYKLTINGSEIDNDLKRRITDITLDKKETGSSLLTIKVTGGLDLSLLTNDYLVKDAKVSFKCAWYDSRTRFASFIGYIAVVDVDFGDSLKITLNCLDESYPMDKDEKSKSWESVKVSDVAKEIFQSYGLTAHVDDTTYVEETISQSNQTDAAFMSSLVGKVTHKVFIWWVDGKDGYFKERVVPQSGGTILAYRSGNNQIQSFNPRLTKGKLKIKKETSDVNSKTGKVAKNTTTVVDNTGSPTGSTSTGTQKKYVNGKWVTVSSSSTKPGIKASSKLNTNVSIK